MPPLRKIRGTANRRETRKLDLRRSIIKRRYAGVRKAANAQRLNHVGIPILLQTIKTESGIANPGLVDEARRDDVRPDRHGVLSPLQFIASPSRHVAG